ncbi:MAG TPA: hypothetical protein VFT09_12260 [Ilumatobacteraceae bacterium]|nr:hypothetical protein [Ilumatobacteraceae bacterium]
MRVRGTIGRSARGAALATAVLALVACSGDDDATDGTLGVIDTGGSMPPSAAGGQPVTTGPAGTAVDPAAAGAGFVSIGVQVASAGIAETISLDRASVPAASLDPVSLDATCTPLDGGDPAAGVVVSVVDLRRLAGDQLVSAVLRFGDAAPGEHDMTLELGGADQVATSYTGTVTVADDGMAGTFQGADAGGTPVSGSFACAAEAIATTTTLVPLDAGEEVPEGETSAETTPG